MTMDPSDVIDLINRNNNVEVYIIEINNNDEIIEYMSNDFQTIVY